MRYRFDRIFLQESVTGEVNFRVCAKCLSLRPWQTVASFLLLGASTAARVLQAWWLSQWSDLSQEEQESDSQFLLSVWGGITAAAVIVHYSRSFTFMTMVVAVSNRLHDLALVRVARAPMLFFDSNPVGRILNRFAKDLATLDDMLPMVRTITNRPY